MRLLNRKPVWDALQRSGVAAAIGRRYGGMGAIFMFHRVAPDDSILPILNGGLYVNAGFLDAWLAALGREGVAIISMDAAVDRLARPSSGPRFVAITFDDGYGDTLRCALPVLERHAAPFTIYLTTALATGEGDLWWLGLERLVEERGAVDVAPMGQRFDTSSLRRKARALDRISHWVWQDVEQRAPMLQEVIARYGVSSAAATSAAGLTCEQVRDLARHPLATIGAHTSGHRHLASLDAGQAGPEMADNKALLERLSGRPVAHFAYPYGAGGSREAALASAAGFKTAVTNRLGCLFPAHRDNLLLLPRLRGTGSRMWLSYMHGQRQGVGRFVASRGGAPAALAGPLPAATSA